MCAVAFGNLEAKQCTYSDYSHMDLHVSETIQPLNSWCECMCKSRYLHARIQIHPAPQLFLVFPQGTVLAHPFSKEKPGSWCPSCYLLSARCNDPDSPTSSLRYPTSSTPGQTRTSMKPPKAGALVTLHSIFIASPPTSPSFPWRNNLRHNICIPTKAADPHLTHLPSQP